METTAVARLLHSHGIQAVYLNACRSAKTGGSSDGNIAAIFIREGFTVAAAMSYNVTSSAAAISTESFYQSILDREEWSVAAWSARKALRLFPKRIGRFGIEIEPDDWPILVVYCSNPVVYEITRLTRTDRFLINFYSLHEELSSIRDLRSCLYIVVSFLFRLSLMLFVQHNAYTSAYKGVKIIERSPLIGRDNELLSLETTFLVPYRHHRTGKRIKRRIIFIHGWGGVGKSAFLSHLASWWRETGLVEDYFVFRFDSPMLFTVDQICIFICHYINGFERVTMEEKYASVVQLLKRRRYLLILDNLDGAYRNTDVCLPEVEKARLSSFISELCNGETFVMLASRKIEDWIVVPHGQIWHYHLKGLTSQACMQLSKCVIESKGCKIPREDENESVEAAVRLFEHFENLPLAVELLSGIMAKIGYKPAFLYDLVHNGHTLPLDLADASDPLGTRIISVMQNELIGKLTDIVLSVDDSEETVLSSKFSQLMGEPDRMLLWLFPLFVSTHCVPEGLSPLYLRSREEPRIAYG